MQTEPRVGLSPEEMITSFNRMFADAWERSKERIDWQNANISKQMAAGKKVDLSAWLVDVMEIIVSAARDSTVFTLAENNQRIAQQLQELGLPVPTEDVPEDNEDFDINDLPRNL